MPPKVASFFVSKAEKMTEAKVVAALNDEGVHQSIRESQVQSCFYLIYYI